MDFSSTEDFKRTFVVVGRPHVALVLLSAPPTGARAPDVQYASGQIVAAGDNTTPSQSTLETLDVSGTAEAVIVE